MEETLDQIEADIKQRFARLAIAPQEEQKFPVGPASAKRLGYDAYEINSLPRSVTESFAGVGNPLALGELRAGQTVLDLGCGAGLDSVLAARRVAPGGKAIGVDFAPEMVEKFPRPPRHLAGLLKKSSQPASRSVVSRASVRATVFFLKRPGADNERARLRRAWTTR